VLLQTTHDRRAGINAFLQKRKAYFVANEGKEDKDRRQQPETKKRRQRLNERPATRAALKRMNDGQPTRENVHLHQVRLASIVTKAHGNLNVAVKRWSKKSRTHRDLYAPLVIQFRVPEPKL